MWIQQKSTPAPLDELQGHTVGLKFECNKCNTEVFTDSIGVPAADHLANSMEDDGQYETEEIKCPGCDMTHAITVKSTFDGVHFDVSDVQPEKVAYQINH
ncbi:hypothetical protein SAMN06265337_1730 [Hymenobacter gelipurpurascens]|uniref:Uncharacterized protein n=1 Tax=Hymenobacter gelipurpurascens TaxID=89968 RepID=A0A212TLL1_9BACT|nr:hypothetical protein [Hymenobacter gelipurpurascens]SNC66790.1 hypothetical protein SAMN06265337_1730 [Hymenobacter gelipurpurascens]